MLAAYERQEKQRKVWVPSVADPDSLEGEKAQKFASCLLQEIELFRQ